MRWWSEAEDGHPGRELPPMTLHLAGTDREHARRIVPAAAPALLPRRIRLVVRHYVQTGETTLALEALRIEGR